LVLVLQQRKALGSWSIGILVLGDHLSLLVSDLLNVILVFVVDDLGLRLLAIIGCLVRTNLLMTQPFSNRFENVLHIVAAVGAAWLSDFSFILDFLLLILVERLEALLH